MIEFYDSSDTELVGAFENLLAEMIDRGLFGIARQSEKEIILPITPYFEKLFEYNS